MGNLKDEGIEEEEGGLLNFYNAQRMKKASSSMANLVCLDDEADTQVEPRHAKG